MPALPCRTADEEPLTEALKYYDQGWFEAGNEEGGVLGRIHLDPQMPYLGATKPKPCGSVTCETGGGRRLLWSPSKPLPALHLGSWDPEHRENLLLHVAGKAGPVARPLLASEARDLLCGKRDGGQLSDSEIAARALAAAPKKLAELTVQWAERELVGDSGLEEEDLKSEIQDNRLGLCRLAWEDETEQVLYRWLQENPAGEDESCGRVGGGKGRKGRRDDEPHPPSYYASKALSRLLRHDGGRNDLPMTHEGWVKWGDLMGHAKLKRFSQSVLYDAVMINDKERFTARPDESSQWWVAAWSGHTIPGCVGPARVVPDREVPAVLIHGTYRRLVPRIEAEGIVPLRRDVHLQDPCAHARRWRQGLEIAVQVDTVTAIELGCHFKVTGNLVWLCSTTIPTEAIVSFRNWDDLQGGKEQVVGDVGRGREKAGLWEPDDDEWNFSGTSGAAASTITEQIAETAKDIAPALSTLGEGGTVEVDPITWEVEVKEPTAASSLPGQDSEEEQCDWSESEAAEVEVVEALPAKREVEEPQVTAGASTEDEPMPSSEEGGVTEEAQPSSGSREPVKDQIEEDGGRAKHEIIEDEPWEPKRRKVLRFGSAHIKLLRAVADADSANWHSLQKCIRDHGGATPGQKTALVERLEELAVRRAESRAGALHALEEHQRKAVEASELEEQYREGLSIEMARLERYNPVGPRSSQPLLNLNRFHADLEAGTGVWQARRMQRSRERAAKHRAAMQASEGVRGIGVAGTLHDVPPEAHAEVLDMTLADRAKEELRNFKAELRMKGPETKPEARSHQKDSQRRKQAKRERAKEKKRARRNSDDAERDQNHAIAHEGQYSQETVASFSPGRPEGAILLTVVLLLCLVKMLLQCGSFDMGPNRGLREHQTGNRVGAKSKRVRFKVERGGKLRTAQQDAAPFLGGPKTAKRLHPPGKPLRFAEIQGGMEWEQEVLSLLMDRYSRTTTSVYQSQYRWWELFCLRRGLDPIRHPKGGYDRAEEQIFLDYIVHSATNEGKAPGTVKLRLAAVRSFHLTMGLPDPTMNMPRIPLALAGVKRRYGTKERRKPVTPTMLTWLGQHLQFGKSAEGSLLWGAICFGYFFLLRASEYLGVGYTDPNRGLRGCDVVLKENGVPVGLDRIGYSDEVVLTIRGSKTDIYNRGEVRNHFRSGDVLCPVGSAVALFKQFPQRYHNGSDSHGPLFRGQDGQMIPRQAVTALLEAAAKALHMPEGDFGTHSLRFGGASAIWAAYGDSTMVKRWGRWSSDSFQTYVWDARKSAKGVASKMSQADLTPS